MYTQPFWVQRHFPGRLGVSARPRGNDWLEDEIKAWRSGGVDIVVSLLTSEEAESLGLGGEHEMCTANRIEYRALPIVDRSVPESVEQVLKFADTILLALQDGKNVVIHCRQGIGRSGLVAAAVMLRSGQSLKNSIQLVSVARGVTVPETEEQAGWIRSFAESI